MNVLARRPITFTVAGGGTSHAPMIIASINGLVGRFVLDTGSEVHLLNEDLADELGLIKEPGEEGTDHSGATMPSWNVGDVKMALGALGVNLAEVVVIPAPAPFPAWGIRGILSPHNLHPTALTVIDMVADELLLLEGSDPEVEASLHERSPALSLLTLPRDPAFTSVVVRAAIEPYSEIPTMLNTGGKATEFSSTAVPGLYGADSRRLGGGVSGADYVGSLAGPQTLLIGDVRVPIPALRVRSVMHDPQGIIGMDVLRGTVLTSGADPARNVVWQVPQSDLASGATLPSSRSGRSACAGSRPSGSCSKQLRADTATRLCRYSHYGNAP